MFIKNDTIYALSTPFGKSGVSVIRISGPISLKLVKILSCNSKFFPRKATLTRLFEKNTNNFIDECIVLYYPKDSSYTGQNLVELQLHGSVIIINKILSTLNLFPKTRLAYNGEFTKLALENNKLSLTRAESLVRLINSESSRQHHIASYNYNGSINLLCNEIKKKILGILSEIEAYIDFSEDMNSYNNNINAMTNDLIIYIIDIAKSFKQNKLAIYGVNIIIIGEVNSGKSTLMNYIFKDDISIISKISGTTRDLIKHRSFIKGIPVVIYDTAGFRKSTNVIEKIGIKKVFNNLLLSDIIIIVYDVNSLLKNNILNLTNNYSFLKTKKIFLYNKIDLIKNKNKMKFLIKILRKNSLDFIYLIKISLVNYNYYNFMLYLIKKNVEILTLNNNNYCLLNKRHYYVLLLVLKCLKNSTKLRELDIKAENLKIAVNNLGILLGKINTDEILNKLFSTFCIGK